MHISFEKSIEILNNNLPQPKDEEKLFLFDALNRILATDIKAPFTSPQYPTASMDGYAIRFEDIKNRIKIVGANPAGSFKYSVINKNEAVKTYTGSIMPKNADTLVPIENVEVKDNFLHIKKEVTKGFAVRKIGEDFFEGEVLLKKFSKITPAEIALLASLGKSIVSVVKKPVISILSTGEEIVDIDESIENQAQIRSSNNYLLTALGRKYGFETINLGIVKDNKKLIKNKIKSALINSDIVVTTGGVSVGDFDFVKEIVNEFEVLFHGVDIKPGQWIMVAKADNKFIVSLPGFPYSSFVTFLLYVVKIADAFMHGNSLKFIDAILENDFEKKFIRTQFIPAHLSIKDGIFYVNTINNKEGSSAILSNILQKEALIMFDYGKYKIKKGSKVKVILY